MKKPAASRRVKLPRRVDYARQFLKDWKRFSLKAFMLLLIANDAPLGPERRNHALKGQGAPYRECHIGDDFLLISRIDDTDRPTGSIYFARAGTHAKLFE